MNKFEQQLEKNGCRPKILQDFIDKMKIQTEDLDLVDQLSRFSKYMITQELHNMFNDNRGRAGEELKDLIKTSQDENKTKLYKIALEFFEKYDWRKSYMLVRILDGEIERI